MQKESDEQFFIKGDSAYLTSYHSKDELIRDYVKWNKLMKHTRISIELNYGTCASLVAYLRKPEKFKVLGSERVSKIYTVAMLYGCQSS